MYRLGLKHVDLNILRAEAAATGRCLRKKDEENYWNGWYRSDLYHAVKDNDPWTLHRHIYAEKHRDDLFYKKAYSEYEQHPYRYQDEPQNRWVPCSAQNRPLIQWSKGCLSMVDACCYPGQVYLGENLKGTKHIVIDCDGDHDETIDWETVNFLSQWKNVTHCLYKKDIAESVSFHLTFYVDRVIPTKHFPWAHIDIVGNEVNSLRYFKTKKWNGKQPMPMTDAIWDELKNFLERRKNELAV